MKKMFPTQPISKFYSGTALLPLRQFSLSILLFVFFGVVMSPHAQGGNPPPTKDEGLIPDAQEYAALKAIYESTGGDNWDNNSNWLQGATSADFATWHGVSVTNGDVKMIDLSGNNLRGNVTEEITKLGAMAYLRLSRNAITALPFTLGDLSNLSELIISGNQLSSLPESIGNLFNLSSLNVSTNQLSSLPESIGSLSNLNTLYVSANQLSNLPESLGNLTNLSELFISGNQLISLPESIGNLSKLKTLLVSKNQLSSLPESFWNLSSLNNLQVDQNQLSSLPESIDNLSNLSYLRANQNQLSSLPVSIGNLPHLSYLQVDQNQLSSLPESIGNLSNLSYLYVHTNQLSSLPESIGYLSNLSNLFAYNNELSSLPESAGNLSNLRHLRINNNQLSSLPESIGNLSNLIILYANQNQLSSLPESIGNLPKLSYLFIHHNKLSSLADFSINANKGNLSVEAHQNDLNFTDLEKNFNSLGPVIKSFIYSPQNSIPAEEIKVTGSSLILDYDAGGTATTYQWFRLDENEQWLPVATTQEYKLSTGFLPVGITRFKSEASNSLVPDLQLTKEFVVEVDANEGRIPDAIEYAALKAIYESTGGPNWTNNSNWLQGTTSADFATWHGISIYEGDVDYLRLDNNNLQGKLPEDLGQLGHLTLLEANNNSITGLPERIGELKYLQDLHLTSNNIQHLPESIGQLSYLRQFSIYKNQLSSLPQSIGNLTNLKRFLVYDNELTNLPESIGNLKNLEVLGVFNNNLTSLPDGLSTLPKLFHIAADNNQLADLPDFSTYYNKANLGVRAQQNDLDFTDLEKNFTSSGPVVNSFIYSPQNSIPAEEITVTGSSLLLDYDAGGTATTYQWYRQDRHGTWVAEASTKEYKLSSNDLPVGITRFKSEAKNSLVPDLQLTKEFVLEKAVNEGLIPDALEYAALKAIYESTGGPNWTNNSNWLQGTTSVDFATWHGIMVQDGDVYMIDLPENNLQGTLPEELGDLKGLTYLNFNSNSINALPSTLGNLSKLFSLEIGANQLSNLPESIGNLSNLSYLQVNENQLQSLPESIGALSNLTEFIGYGNQLRSLPESIGNLSNLKLLYLASNQLQSLPESIGHLSNLSQLIVYRNQLTSLPVSIGNLSNLFSLVVEFNQLQSLPESIGNLSNLSYLHLYRNQLSSLPESIGNLSNLIILSVSVNQLSSLPESIGKLSNLDYLDLVYNKLTNLPESIGNLSNLSTFSVHTNQLSTLPESIGNLSNLSSLNLWRNQLSSLPESIGSLSNLSTLQVTNNQLSSLPVSIGDLLNLTRLSLATNQLTSIPDFSVFSNSSNLEARVHNNFLTFNEIEKNLTAQGAPITKIYEYKPQKIKIDSVEVRQGVADTLTFDAGAKQITHQWQLQTEAGEWENIAGKTGEKLALSASEVVFDARYRAVATSGLLNFSITREFVLYGDLVYEGQVPDAQEYAALKALYESTGGDNWANNSNWLQGTTSADFATWHGIMVQDGDVYMIDLPENNLQGTLPEELGDLIGLTYLNLYSNSLTALPTTLGKLTNLYELNIERNSLISLPENIGNLSNLFFLNIGNNQLSSLPESIGDLSNLSELHVLNNQLVSLPSRIGDLSNLNHLAIYNNPLSILPESIGKLSNLYELQLIGMPLNSLPESIGNLSSLTYLYCMNNQLSKLPESVGNLVNLERLVVMGNKLNSLPESIRNIPGLSMLVAVDNNLVSLPDFSTFTAKPNLYVYVYDNFLTFYELEKNLNAEGIPVTKSFTYDPQNIKLDSVEVRQGVADTLTFDAGAKQITHQWQLQTEAGEWENISGKTEEQLALSASEVVFDARYRAVATSGLLNFSITREFVLYGDLVYEGQVPDDQEYAALKALYDSTNGDGWINNSNWLQGNTSIDFATWHGIEVQQGDVVKVTLPNNNLAGVLPSEIGKLRYLKSLTLNNNKLTGQLTDSIGGLTNLLSLQLQYNKIAGNIPEGIGELQKLSLLNMAFNKLSGALPESFAHLKSLRILNLGFNYNVEGEFPSYFCEFTQLEGLNIAANKFSGPFPDCLLDLPKIHQIGIPGNDFTGEIPQDIGVRKNLVSLYLTNNKFTGKIPESIGKMSRLVDLHLGGNQFEGGIPDTLGNLVNLRQLYLSGNKLKGEIPASFANLTKLQRLHISNCLLEGEVPDFIIQFNGLQNLFLDGNNFSSLADLSSHSNKLALNLRVSNNLLTFKDLEPNIINNGGSFKKFTYNPQQNLKDTLIYSFSDPELQLKFNAGGTATTYTWSRLDETEQWVALDGESKTLIIPRDEIEPGTTYRCSANNKFLPGLTLVKEFYINSAGGFIVINTKSFSKVAGLELKIKKGEWEEYVEVGRTVHQVVPSASFEPNPTFMITLSAPGATEMLVQFTLNQGDSIEDISIMESGQLLPANEAYLQAAGNQIVFHNDRSYKPEIKLVPQLEDGLIYRPIVLKQGLEEKKMFTVKGVETLEAYSFEVKRVKDGTLVYQSQDPSAAWDGSNYAEGTYQYKIYSQDQLVSEGQFLLIL